MSKKDTAAVKVKVTLSRLEKQRQKLEAAAGGAESKEKVAEI